MIDKEIKLARDCMGCHGCINVCPKNCIDMEADIEGFLYPQVDYALCISCNQCVKKCPIINKHITENTPVAYGCLNRNEKIRLESSSGGVFTLIADYVIDDGGVVFGAYFNDKFELEHNYISSKEELSKLRGSKYLQSTIGNSYTKVKYFLEQGMKVLFSGTPCQIGGLKSFLGKEVYANLITVDIICHGVPSPKVWSKYLEFREKNAKSQAQRIAFRQKNEGWKRFSVSFLFKNDTEYRRTLSDDLYMRAFLKDICLRPSCYDCEFKTLNRESDITLADFWGVQSLLPEMDDDKGTSLVFVNSGLGRKIFDIISKEMEFREVDIKEAIVHNSAAIKSAQMNSNRDKFFAELDELAFDKLFKKYCGDKFFNRIKRIIKRIIKKLLLKIGLFELFREFRKNKGTE